MDYKNYGLQKVVHNLTFNRNTPKCGSGTIGLEALQVKTMECILFLLFR